MWSDYTRRGYCERCRHERYHVGTMGRMAMTLRTDAELDAALTRLSQERGISKQEVVRRAVLDLAERDRHRSRVGEVADAAIEQYAEALHRLGTV